MIDSLLAPVRALNHLNMEINIYGIMMVGGFVLSILLLIVLSVKYKTDLDNSVYIFVFACIGALIGAKLLYLVVSCPQIIEELKEGEPIEKYITGGMVFYGGLIGAFIMAFHTAKAYNVNIFDYSKVLLPSGAILSAAGRVGCHFTGCCYGCEWNWGITYEHSLIAPNGVTLFPTQLTEASFDIGLALLMIYLGTKEYDGKSMTKVYLSTYAIFRFLLEFLRGDAARGVYILSVSQWISIAILLLIFFKREKVQLTEKNL